MNVLVVTTHRMIAWGNSRSKAGRVAWKALPLATTPASMPGFDVCRLFPRSAVAAPIDPLSDGPADYLRNRAAIQCRFSGPGRILSDALMLFGGMGSRFRGGVITATAVARCGISRT